MIRAAGGRTMTVEGDGGVGVLMAGRGYKGFVPGSPSVSSAENRDPTPLNLENPMQDQALCRRAESAVDDRLLDLDQREESGEVVLRELERAGDLLDHGRCGLGEPAEFRHDIEQSIEVGPRF